MQFLKKIGKTELITFMDIKSTFSISVVILHSSYSI